jgi:hypothetical protein
MYAPGTQGIVAAPGGYAVFTTPAIGVILYRYGQGQFQPATQAAYQGGADLLRIVVGVVLEVVAVGGIAVKVIVRIGSLNLPSPAPCPGTA